MKKVLLASLFALSVSNAAFADDIIDSAVADGSLKTLVTALQTAGLTDTLKGEGPFTVFAPSDAAFAKLPKDKLEALLKDKDALVKLLNAHIVAHKITSDDVTAGKVKSVEGHELKLDVTAGIKVDGIPTVGGGDIKADNGMIYVLDTVLLQEHEGKKKVSKKKAG
ncbi:fasciclin domain-containing protein [Methylotenera sp. N17]|uniref:fasciclin domain-containing protein n=1 Tax=Methylotenera sp. N17 TaxID=1502761 RepID=UPI000645D11B|nr:fasciclin domain-containing protein [Methylotenera sp. N17]